MPPEARPAVSVVVPVYNGERFLGEALAGVFSQTYPPAEVIVVDDGSTDGTRAAATADPRVTYLHQPNQGVAVARNAGAARVTGDLVAFLDADDVWLPEKLARQVDYLLTHPEVGLVFCQQRYVVSTESGGCPPWVRSEQLEQDHPGYVPSAMLVRREVLAAVGPFDASYHIGDDSDWFFRARDLGVGVAVVPETLLLKRAHDTNLTADIAATQAELLRVVKTSLSRRKAAGTRAASSVSVVIPVYNGERYLAEAVESVLAQTTSPGEIIVVDDGSTDGSAALAASSPPPVRCLRRPHAGIGATRNAGIEASRGDYLAFLDADDLWLPDKLERQLAAIQDAGLDGVFSQMEQFVSPDVDEATRAGLVCPPGPAAGRSVEALLIRREAFLRVGFFATECRMGEFIDWFARARAAGLRLGMVPRVLVRRRLHGGNHSLRNKDHLSDYAVILKAALDRKRRGAAGGAGEGTDR